MLDILHDCVRSLESQVPQMANFEIEQYTYLQSFMSKYYIIVSCIRLFEVLEEVNTSKCGSPLHYSFTCVQFVVVHTFTLFRQIIKIIICSFCGLGIVPFCTFAMLIQTTECNAVNNEYNYYKMNECECLYTYTI